jgi:uncharacterized damage-inducible protein DinB
MKDLAITETNQAIAAQFIQTLINAWSAQNKAVTNFFQKYEDAAYQNEVSPGRNRAIYLLGHLISSNDGILPLLGISERLYPELNEKFSLNPDRAFTDLPTLAKLKQYWETVTQNLTEAFTNIQPHEWLEKHTAVSREDFLLNPNRNKLNILISRTTHQSYHLGQLAFLVKKD